MVITTVDSVPRSSVAALIGGYQKHISPKKGFSCAYRVLHGKESCSEFIKRTILEQGLIEAIPAARHRLQACKAANQVLRATIETPNPNKEAQRRHRGRNCDTLANSSCSECIESSCLAIDTGLGDSEGCVGCHSDLDYGILNCSGADCGSCGG
ncbi:membrane protein insertion efficiency factor YidD [Microcoleus sp. FACHB-672]|uniref:membrane protein insertion efficiency factor YidD n=1 Tax=Microcoleus sp. FACHB-672 TaxID=2692825 RepID=UPI0016854005|nr:membrane protein insertion efficiency factor YidD [Microcoleus sp. FACHB-672]MBD2039188.1 membrane protein insertion efficiency factor YidD [Microcoleus sp. FACHB-672]